MSETATTEIEKTIAAAGAEVFDEDAWRNEFVTHKQYAKFRAKYKETRLIRDLILKMCEPPNRQVYYDTSLDEFIICGKVGLNRETIAPILEYIEELSGITAPANKVLEFTETLGNTHKQNGLADYLENDVKWDGVKRLDSIATMFFGDKVPDADIANHILSRWMLAAVKRRCFPQISTKWDIMPILVGEPHIGKSLFVERLFEGGKYRHINCGWATTAYFLTKKYEDTIHNSMGRAVLVLDEMTGFDHKGKQAYFNSFMSQQVDRARLTYAAASMTKNRSFVCIGTSNKKNILHNTDGNRRACIIECPEKIDTEKARKLSTQLLAEAYIRIKQHDLEDNSYIFVDDDIFQRYNAKNDGNITDTIYDSHIKGIFKQSGYRTMRMEYLLDLLSHHRHNLSPASFREIGIAIKGQQYKNAPFYNPETKKTERALRYVGKDIEKQKYAKRWLTKDFVKEYIKTDGNAVVDDDQPELELSAQNDHEVPFN